MAFLRGSRPRPRAALVGARVGAPEVSRGLAEIEGAVRRLERRADATPSDDELRAPTVNDIWPVAAFGGVAGATATTNRNAIQDAINAAVRAQRATGRRQVVLFSTGYYGINKGAFSTQASFFLNGVEGIIFTTAVAGGTTLRKEGSAGSDDWYLFRCDNCLDMWFLGLTFDGSMESDYDPTLQDHALNFFGPCSQVIIRDCTFQDFPVGDAIRMVGNLGSWISDFEIMRCRFFSCSRAPVGFQRYCRRIVVFGNYFWGGDDQQVDFEPTGYQLIADAGGSATLFIDSATNFITGGVQVGDEFLNITTGELCYVASIVSANQITTTPLSVGTWAAGTQAMFFHNPDHQIVGNYFDYTERPTTGNEVVITLSSSQRLLFACNTIVYGTIDAGQVHQISITDNIITTGKRGDSDPAIALRDAGSENVIARNIINNRNSGIVTRPAIQYIAQGSFRSLDVIIEDNVIRSETASTGGVIRVESARQATVRRNHIIKASTSVNSIAIAVRAVLAMDHVDVTENRIYAEAGYPDFTKGIQLAALSQSIATCRVGGGLLDACGIGISFEEGGGGVFTNPPLVEPTVNNATTTALVLPPSVPWVVLGGLAGTAPVARMPQWLYGTGDPNGVVDAARGSMASRTDGGAGTSLYVKESPAVAVWAGK
jgi:hypothetical protein